jgi:K+/H+ antiporter YhaU regulatory subunit KhtT
VFVTGVDAAAGLRALSYAAVLTALVFVATVAHPPVTRALGATPLVEIAYAGAFVLLCAPVALGLARAVRQLVDRLVRAILPPEATSRRALAAAAVLRATLYAFLALLVGVVVLAAGAAFLPPLPLVAVVVLLVASAAWVLRGALRRFNRQLEEAVDTVFRSESAPGSRDAVLALLRERYPWDLHALNVIVPTGSRAAGQRIRELQLPQRTGATIVTHDRDGELAVNPPPDTLISPGDTLGVLGELEQVEAARAFLTAEAPLPRRPVARAGEGVEIEEIEVASGSPLSGVTLAGSRIRETTGASVVGVRREGVPILNPAPVLRLQPGDSVVVLGSPAQVKAARRLLGVE